MYKGILLDIDNTLYVYEPVHQFAQKCLFKNVSRDFSISLNDIGIAFNKAKLHVKQDSPETASSHNRLLYIQKFCEFLLIDSLQHSLSLYEIYWSNFLKKMELTAGAKDFLHNSNGKNICLVTDLTAHIQHRKIAKLGLHQWASKMVTSEEAGCEKPHPYMFHLALTKLEMQASDVCMVGDNYKKDILGASRLGIASYWLNSGGLTRPASFNSNIMTEIKDLRELKWL